MLFLDNLQGNPTQQYCYVEFQCKLSAKCKQKTVFWKETSGPIWKSMVIIVLNYFEITEYKVGFILNFFGLCTSCNRSVGILFTAHIKPVIFFLNQTEDVQKWASSVFVII